MINTLHSTHYDPMDYVAHQAPLSVGFARQEYGYFLLQGYLPDSGIELGSPALEVDSVWFYLIVR